MAKELTYVEFPTKFVWKTEQKQWLPRQRGFSIRQLFFVHPTCGEFYYLRILLNHVKGPTSYEDIKTVDGVFYSTFKQTCYAMGLLDDDNEYIEAIKEASLWASAHCLRQLFTDLFLSNSV